MVPLYGVQSFQLMGLPVAPPPVHLALVFHCNQAITPFAQVAVENCYRGLVRVLRRHPAVAVNFHWSGSLLTGLQWMAPELLDEVREEAAGGRWELLASTYAQNVHFTGPAELNALALKMHRAVLAAAFPGVKIRGHWISERSWHPALAAQIASSGLEYTLIEDHMLAAAGCEDLQRPRRLAAGPGRDLVVFTDHERFKHRVNWALWTGDVEPALSALRETRSAHARPDLPPILTWAEDGEVTGLWALHRGVPPQVIWAHLDRLLTALEREPGVRLTRLCDYLDRFGGQIPAERRRVGPGQAKWMCASLADANLPYHEDGFADWFDFNRRSPKVRRFRPVFGRAARDLMQVAPRTPAERRLWLHAGLALTSHTFEFGCIGIGGPRARMWEAHRTSRVAQHLLLDSRAGHRTTGVGRADLNGDGRLEIVAATRDVVSLWSARTGALLGLFDRRTGDELAGNELAESSIYGRGHDDEAIPEIKPAEKVWSAFRSRRQRVEEFEGWSKLVPRDEAWMRHLIDWTALPHAPAKVAQVQLARDAFWALENGTQATAGVEFPPPVRQRALVERLTVDGDPVLDIAALSRQARTGLRLTGRADGFDLTLVRRPVTVVKRVRLRGPEIAISHTFTNLDSRAHHAVFTLTSEWAPSYLAVLLFGRRALEATTAGARNTQTGAGVSLTVDTGPGCAKAFGLVERTVREALFGLLDERRVELTLVPGEIAALRSTLRVTAGSDFRAVDAIAAAWAGMEPAPQRRPPARRVRPAISALIRPGR